MAQLSGSTDNFQSSIADINAVHTTDWLKFAAAGVMTKNGGGSTIGSTVAGFDTTGDPNARTIGWTNGTPTASGSDNNAHFDGATDVFTLPASTTVRKAVLYLGTSDFSAGVQQFTITVTLSDGSAGPYVFTTTGANAAWNITLTYAAASAGQTLTASIVGNGGGGWNMLLAVGYSPAPPPPPWMDQGQQPLVRRRRTMPDLAQVLKALAAPGLVAYVPPPPELPRAIRRPLIDQPWAPPQKAPPVPVAGLKLWLEADFGITKDGSNNVLEWDDQSGNGNNALPGTSPLWVPGAAGVLNGNPRVLFTTAQALVGAANVVPSGNARTIFIVQRLGAGTTGGVFQFKTGTPFYQVMWSSGGSNTNVYTDGVSNAQAVPTLDYDQTAIVTQAWDGNTLHDVTAKTNGQSPTVVHNLGSGTPNDTGTAGYKVGAGFDGEIAAILVYDTALSAANELLVRFYLARKYGILQFEQYPQVYTPPPPVAVRTARLEMPAVFPPAAAAPVLSWAPQPLELARRALRAAMPDQALPLGPLRIAWVPDAIAPLVARARSIHDATGTPYKLVALTPLVKWTPPTPEMPLHRRHQQPFIAIPLPIQLAPPPVLKPLLAADIGVVTLSVIADTVVLTVVVDGPILSINGDT